MFLNWHSVLEFVTGHNLTKADPFSTTENQARGLADISNLFLSWRLCVLVALLTFGVLYRMAHGGLASKSGTISDKRLASRMNRGPGGNTESSSEEETYEDDERSSSPFDALVRKG